MVCAVGMNTSRVASSSTYAPRIGFSAALRAGDLVITAGMTAVDTEGAIVGDQDPYAQAAEALRKVREALEAAGADIEQVIQTRIVLARADCWEAVGRAHGELFADIRPAATMIVATLIDPRMLVEIEATAYVGTETREAAS